MIRCWPLLAAGAGAAGIAAIELFGGGTAQIPPPGRPEGPAVERAAPARAAAPAAAGARMPASDGIGMVCWWEAGGYHGPFLAVVAGSFLPGSGGHGGGGGYGPTVPAGPPGAAGPSPEMPSLPGNAGPLVPGSLPGGEAPGRAGGVPQDVPEPGSALLLAGGLVALMLRRRA